MVVTETKCSTKMTWYLLSKWDQNIYFSEFTEFWIYTYDFVLAPPNTWGTQSCFRHVNWKRAKLNFLTLVFIFFRSCALLRVWWFSPRKNTHKHLHAQFCSNSYFLYWTWNYLVVNALDRWLELLVIYIKMMSDILSVHCAFLKAIKFWSFLLLGLKQRKGKKAS